MNKLILGASAIALLSSVAARADMDTTLLASASSPGDAQRTIVIQPGTQYVNVNHGEVVKFIDNDHEFAVRFDGVRSSFDLSAVAPAGALDHRVVAYVAPDADYDE